MHATNGWCSHLLPALRAKIAPARGAMSAQRPGTSLHRSTLAGARSYVFYRGTAGYDYLTQLPSGGDSENELMFGGGWAQACDDGLPEIGIADDSVFNHASQSYLAGALPQYFGLANWGGDASAPKADDEQRSGDEAGHDGVRWHPGRTKAQWSGVLGISADLLPWVGRVPEKLARRTPPKPQPMHKARTGTEEGKNEARKAGHLAAPGEWIAAGYSGEGMVHAWMSGKALAHMILDRDDEIREWFPDVLRVTEQRWKNADFDHLVSRFIGA